MAEPLKNQFGPDIPARIAAMIGAVHRSFDARGFVRDVLAGYEPLELMPRGWKIARALCEYLPADYPKAVGILVDSLGPKLEGSESHGMAPFVYMPHAFFVGKYGLGHFEESMRAQYEITQRFTAEFSIRPYLIHHQEATLARLREWTSDGNEHVRRLVSEGTRPRLPWAPRLPAFQRDPAPVLALLELLKDDLSLYVRRSVANNLNDFGKDHPDVLAQTATRWLKGASEEREWLVRHALRSAIKRGETGALHALGFGRRAAVDIENVSIAPRRPRIGGDVVIGFDVVSRRKSKQTVLVDFRIHYVKANGGTRPKVFKLASIGLDDGERVCLKKRVTLADLTTRKHHPGKHAVDALINGHAVPLGAFTLRGAQ
ncbi:MAG: DNA alkylation repair protein [Betaproteobacteria bacterium]|nr:DNA alkylation repair protein [Betaproteobacteria bacterium]